MQLDAGARLGSGQGHHGRLTEETVAGIGDVPALEIGAGEIAQAEAHFAGEPSTTSGTSQQPGAPLTGDALLFV